MSLITIATDYGSSDGFTAAVIGVIKSLAPRSEILCVTDELHTIEKASLILFRYYKNYPSETVHLMIIDPTVGSARKGLAGYDGEYFYVGPDNGIFSRVISDGRKINWYEIDSTKLPPRKISATFHGRDIFAPAAALLSNGVSPAEFGRPFGAPYILDLPKPVGNAGLVKCEIIDIDSFGNLILNFCGDSSDGNPKAIIGEIEIPFHKTFSDVVLGEPLLYRGSLGFLEIAVNGGRADKYFDLKVGSGVMIEI